MSRPQIPSFTFRNRLLDDNGNLTSQWQKDFSILTSVALAWSEPPAHANSPGTSGQIAYDSNFFYVCVSKNSWKRVGLSSW